MDSESRIVFRMDDIENIKYVAESANIAEWKLLISALEKSMKLNVLWK